ncbi:MAG: P1 family peptidase [Anaerolineae bacterium]|nr:P1 family peptidase [Anaerolineae bacterium]
MARPRLRDLGITIGRLPTGPFNAITDVPGVRVGHTTFISDEPCMARTGVTIVAPRPGPTWQDHVFAGWHSFNGCGEMTGLHWITESGRLGSEIALTGTFSVGAVHDAMVAYAVENESPALLPVVGETYDGYLSDGSAFCIGREEVFAAIAAAADGPVAEGNVGSGTGMMCYDFKGGIGTASRVAETKSGPYTVGALVQANHGDRPDLRMDGVPVGREIGPEHTPTPGNIAPESGSSILIIVATDAPLLPFQCQRLARRATVGLARTGTIGHNWSGDIFLGFSTANHLPPQPNGPHPVEMLPNAQMDPIFLAVAEAVEEAILNVLCAAETMTGWQGHIAYALPLDALVEVMRKYHRLGA